MKGSWPQVVFIVVAALLVHGFVRMAITAEQKRTCASVCLLAPNYAGRDRLAPDFELPTLDGTTLRLSDYRGKVVVLNFWTRTCAPCRQEMPALADLAHAAKKRGDFVVLTINTDDGADAAREIVEGILGGPAPFPVALDPERDIVTGKYGTRLLPETWFIDPKGVIRARFDGKRAWKDPLVLELIETLGSQQSCRIELSNGTPVGGPAWLCGDDRS